MLYKLSLTEFKTNTYAFNALHFKLININNYYVTQSYILYVMNV